MNAPTNPPEVDPRIYLAAERTLLAWIRTGIALMGFGLVVAKLQFFLHELLLLRSQIIPTIPPSANWGGSLLLGLGVIVIGAAAIRHQRYINHLNQFGAEAFVPRRFPLVISAALVLVGIFLTIHLITTTEVFTQ